MQSQDSNPQRRHPGTVFAIKGSLLLAAFVLFGDVASEGFYVWSLLICPLWFLISVVKNLLRRPGWRIAALRVAMPLLTFGIAISNANLQWRISDAHAEQVIKACNEFQTANGRYPAKLEDLVPKYLVSVPCAKYCMMGKFSYVNSDGHARLWWTRYGFYRRIFDFDKKRWSSLD